MADQEKFVRCKDRFVHIEELIKEGSIASEVAVFGGPEGPHVLGVDKGGVQGRILPAFDEEGKADSFQMVNSEFQQSDIKTVDTDKLVAVILKEALFLFNPSPDDWLEYEECFFILGNHDR